ncbi:hypothetical protein MKW98_029838 [Papaver atlanticum]|uniref:Uncharacterized protein n=1 Tax=Papaver atlanticum TaxID=357466 RepID=A0AAD4TJJ6_9MAGN|nr:hypothetical protein MKW98_029838 [Papaver atlanticum]
MSTELPVCVYKSQPVLICPEKPTPKCPLYLSNMDNLNFLRHAKVEFLFVYRKSIPIKNLKSSLSKVLFHYYPLAGRFRNCAEDEDRLEVDCNGKGALLAEGFMDFTADEFLNDNAWLNMAWKDKLLFKVDAKSDLDIPSLVIQVTYLSCGGMLMCIHMNHCITDGVGASKNLHDWAHLHAKPNMDLPIPPVHNHDLLRPRNPLQIPFDHPEFTNITQDFDIPKYFRTQQLAPSCLAITQSHIQRLKTLCEPSVKCSTFEALASHVWRCYIKALNLPSSLKIKLFFIYACAETTVNEIVTAKVNHIVKLIQNSKRRVLSNDYVRSVIDIIEEINLQLAMSTTLFISDWRTLGIEKLDFGEGKPLHAGQLSSETYCLFLPQIGGCNAIKVLVSVPKKVVHKFEYYMMNDILQKDDELINREFEFEGKNIKSRI